MEYDNEISSSEDKFDFSLLNDEIISIHKEINNRKSNNKHGNEIRDIRRRKIRIINNDKVINSVKAIV